MKVFKMMGRRVNLEGALRSFPRVEATQGYVDSHGVFIGSAEDNMPTYVLVEREDGPWTCEGQRVALYSVNGAGEVRWDITSADGWGGNAAKQAIEAFGLVKAD